MQRLVLLSLVLGFAYSAAAQTPAVAPADAATPTTATEDASTDQASKDKPADRTCLRETGSRLIRADRDSRKCAIAFGRSYTREDLQRTGEVDLADALRRLDPAIR